MKNISIIFCLAIVLLATPSQAQKVKIYKARIFYFDQSTQKGVLYDVSPQGIVLLDTKTVSAMSAKDIQEAVLNSHLPSFIVPFEEVQRLHITRRRSAGKGFGIGYLASFITLETIMASIVLSFDDKTSCDGSPKKATLGDALIGASCAAPPGIFFNGIASLVGGGIGSLVGSIPVKQIRLDSQNPEMDARGKLKKYALLLQMSR
ncbi:MAG: hypothetical protein KKG00_12515 [Bacteroidetes bacterium]|nr:hypothetical protein [Bacteroidota bacterium]